MAMRDRNKRTMRDYIDRTRSHYSEASSGAKWGWALGAFAVLALIIFMMFAVAGPRTTGNGTAGTPPMIPR